MEPGHHLRTVRRATGLSQRGLAQAAGVRLATVQDIERGATSPTVGTLARLLEAAGFELVVDRAVAGPCRHLLRYLRLTLAERLYAATGGRLRPTLDHREGAWTQLWRLTGYGQVELVGTLAAGLWTPVIAQRPAVLVTPACPERALPAVGALDVGQTHAGVRAGCVRVSFQTWSVFVLPPALLALDGAVSEHRVALRAAAAALDARSPLDDAGRRVPAHRDVSPWRDTTRVMHTKAYRGLPVPDGAAGRGWQLDGPASLAQWLRAYGYPT